MIVKQAFLALFLAGVAYGQSATPVITPAPGTYSGSVTITITGEATVYYTTDGSTPTANSTKYVAPFVLSATKTVRAISIRTPGPVASAAYTVVPVATTYPYVLGFVANKLFFAYKVGGAVPAAQTTAIWDTSPCPPPTGVPTCHWPVTVTSDVPWLSATGGTTSFILSATVNPATLTTAGTFTGNIILTQVSFKSPTTKIPVQVTVTTGTPPPPTHSAKLTWSAASNATGFKVYRSATSGGPYSQLGITTTTNYLDSTVTSGAKVCYTISALYPSESAKSNEVCATVPTP